LHGLGGESDDGQAPQRSVLTNDLHGFVAIHLRHHDVHEHNGKVGGGFDGGDGLASGTGGEDGHATTFQNTGEGEDVADVIVDDEDLAAVKSLVGLVQAVEHALLLGGQIGDNAMEEEGSFI